MCQSRLPDYPTALRLKHQIFIWLVFAASNDVTIPLRPRFKCITHFDPLPMLFSHFNHY
jgi:hypothetical protein